MNINNTFMSLKQVDSRGTNKIEILEQVESL